MSVWGIPHQESRKLRTEQAEVRRCDNSLKDGLGFILGYAKLCTGDSGAILACVDPCALRNLNEVHGLFRSSSACRLQS